ncbi:MAG: polysaccharide deacetylase family protein [Planctomycetota bacterium]
MPRRCAVGEIYAKRGAAVRLVYLAGALAWWVLSGFGMLGRRTTIVLCYHAVRDGQHERFERQMRSISDRCVARVGDETSGGLGLPRVALTSDDAFECLNRNARPLLESLGIEVGVYAVTGNPGDTPRWDIASDHPEASERTMTEAELREADASPAFRIGSHTVSHPRLAELDESAIRAELTESKRRLDELLARGVDELALPHGSVDERVLKIAGECGYRTVYLLGAAASASSGAGAVPRCSMSPDVWPIEFFLTTRGAYGWLPAFRGLVRRVIGGGGAPAARTQGATA